MDLLEGRLKESKKGIGVFSGNSQAAWEDSGPYVSIMNH